MSILGDYNPDFEALLDYLKQNCGCDLTLYKRTSLMRRFQHRMRQLDIENYTSYLQYLKAHPSEFTPLLNTIFINFSGFFRDPDAWDYLASTIIPQIITNKQPQEKIRVWSAGCASGQEVYTVAMLLAEALGVEQYLQRVQIFATDVDEDVLKLARQGSFTEKEVASVPIELVSKYFHKTQQSYVFDSKLRSTFIFGHHNLAINAPMSKIDLLVCRNVLIYFNLETQATVFVRFHFALTSKGFLFLGKSESLINNRNLFIPVSLKHRIFAKGQNLTLDDHLFIRPHTPQKKPLLPITTQVRVWQTAFQDSPFAQLTINPKGRLVAANEKAYALFGLKNSDLGAKVQNLELGRVVNSSVLIRQLNRDRRAHQEQNIKWVTETGTTHLDIYIKPILDESDTLLGANLTFIDITKYIKLESQLESLRAKLASLTQ